MSRQSSSVSAAPDSGDNPAPDTPFYTPVDEHPNATSEPSSLTPEEKLKAAALIQRNYRGYRERRQLAGIGTDPASKRWTEVRAYLRRPLTCFLTSYR